MTSGIELSPLPVSRSTGTARSSVTASITDDLGTPPAEDSDVESKEANLEGAATEALPPVDGGRDAWLFLLGATVIEVLVWGLPFSVGVLHSYWTTELFPPDTPGESLLTLAATLQTGLMYCSLVIFVPLLARYPHRRLAMQATGLAVAVTGLVGSAFASKPWHLLLTLGCIYPFSGLLYLPAATLLFEWFQTRRGLAAGIMYGGTGAGGTVFPFIMQALLNRFGYRTTMIALGIGFGLLGSAALTVIKPRIPIPPRGSPDAMRARKIGTTFLKQSAFYAFAGSILFTSLGNFIPSVFIPSFALDLNLTASDGTLLVAAMNAASVPGLLLLGWLSDRWPLRVVITISCCGSAIACLLLWGFATSISMLVVFSIVFGALGLSFTAVWVRFITVVAKDNPILPSIILSIFSFARGIGNLSSGPISNSLLNSNSFAGAKGGYGVKNYGSLLLYSGLTMLAGSIAGVLYRDERKEEA